MTSKQAQRRYRQQSAPRISKEEQRKLDRQGEERDREEKEAGRSRLRAKAARDRKRAKDDAERDVRRKNGLPTARCRPSQGLISGFARAPEPANKRPREQDEPLHEAGGGGRLVFP